MPIPVGARSNTRACGRMLTEIVGSNPAGYICECCILSSIGLCFGLVQRSPTECDVSECNRKGLIMWRAWTARVCRAMGGWWGG
jgi:hypothetical protein